MLRIEQRRLVERRTPTDLDLSLQLLEVATVDDFPLTRLETIDNGRDGSNVVGHGEEDELLVDEVRVRDDLDGLIEERSRLQINDARKRSAFDSRRKKRRKQNEP